MICLWVACLNAPKTNKPFSLITYSFGFCRTQVLTGNVRNQWCHATPSKTGRVLFSLLIEDVVHAFSSQIAPFSWTGFDCQRSEHRFSQSYGFIYIQIPSSDHRFHEHLMELCWTKKFGGPLLCIHSADEVIVFSSPWVVCLRRCPEDELSRSNNSSVVLLFM